MKRSNKISRKLICSTPSFRPTLALLLTLGAALGQSHAAFGGPEQQMTAEEILTAHIAALGGEKALSQINSVQQKGQLTVESQFTGTVSGSLEMLIIPRQKIYRSAELGAFSTVAAWDGKTGWEQGPRGFRTLQGKELEQLRAQSQIFFSTGLWRLPKSQISRQANETLDGKAHYVLEYSHPTIATITMYLNPDTFLPAQGTQMVQIPGVGEVIAISDFWDYQSYGGIMLPATVSLSIEGVFATETVFADTVINGTIDETLFTAPQ